MQRGDSQDPNDVTSCVKVLVRFAVVASVALATLACAPRPVVPVDDLSRPAQRVEVFRIVRPGDTLYALSWAAGVDYRELAAWNGIEPPYVVQPGQRISLVPTGRKPRPAPSGPRVSTLPDDTAGTGRTALDPKTPSPAPVTPAPSSTPVATRSDAPQPAADRLGNWQWPIRGRVVADFSKSRGLDIAVAAGTPVKAAAGGRVVYAGSGLRGYGQLVIVKHSAEYLSAYGHNRKLLVQEGDNIVGGQVIAESGSAPGKGDQIHFEIRRNGKPVDPAPLLPTAS